MNDVTKGALVIIIGSELIIGWIAGHMAQKIDDRLKALESSKGIGLKYLKVSIQEEGDMLRTFYPGDSRRYLVPVIDESIPIPATNKYTKAPQLYEPLSYGNNYTNSLTNKPVRTNELEGTKEPLSNNLIKWSTSTNSYSYWEAKQTNFMSYTGEVVRIGEDNPDSPWQHSVAFYHFTDEQWRLLTNYYGLSTNWMDTQSVKLNFYGPTNRIPK